MADWNIIKFENGESELIRAYNCHNVKYTKQINNIKKMWRKNTKSQKRAEILYLLALTLKAKKVWKVVFQVHVPGEPMKEYSI